MPAPTLTFEDLDTELTAIRGAILNAIGSTGVDRLDALTLTEAAIKGLQGRLAQVSADPIANIQALVKQVEERAKETYDKDAWATFIVRDSGLWFIVSSLGRPSIHSEGDTVDAAYADIMGKLGEREDYARLLARTLDVDGTVLPEAREVV